MTSKDSVSKQDILELISFEKETYGQYMQLCAHYQIDPDPRAISFYRGKMKILTSLLDGMMMPTPQQTLMSTLKTKT